MKTYYFKSLDEVYKASNFKKNTSFIPECLYTTIPIKENNDPIIDFEAYCKKNKLDIIIESVWKKEGFKNVKIRSSVAKKLFRVRKKLKKKNNFLTIKITDAYRPLSLQKKLFNQIYKKFLNKKKWKSRKDLYLEVTKYVADPNNNPPHSTGGAVDVCLFNFKTGKEVDMGGKIDSTELISSTFFPNISKEAKKNRKLLFDLMTSEGFANVATEWWHYSYGDQYWAAIYKKKQAIFGVK